MGKNRQPDYITDTQHAKNIRTPPQLDLTMENFLAMKVNFEKMTSKAQVHCFPKPKQCPRFLASLLVYFWIL